MFGRFTTSACAVGAMALVTLMPSPSRAQSAGAMLGGLAGGVLGGMIAGSMAAQAARHRPVIVYARPRREVRRVPRRAVVRAERRPMQPAAGPTSAQIVNASADPFANARGNATTTVNRTR